MTQRACDTRNHVRIYEVLYFVVILSSFVEHVQQPPSNADKIDVCFFHLFYSRALELGSGEKLIAKKLD